MARTRKTSTGLKRGQPGRGAKRSRPGASGKGGSASATKKTTKKTSRKTAKKASGTVRKSGTTRPGKKIKSTGTGKKTSGKTRLDKKHLDEFRETLLEKRRMLLGDLNGMEENAVNRKGSGNLSTMPTHMADVGTDNFEHEFTLGLLESEQSLLREINLAIRRVEDGTYGICLGTGRRIPLARLRAKPWAKYTVEYARMLEQGLVRPREAGEEVEKTETAPVTGR